MSRRPGSGSERFGGVKALAEAEHTSTSVSHVVRSVQTGFDWFDLKTGGESCLAGCARGFDQFDLKMGGESRLRGVQEGLASKSGVSSVRPDGVKSEYA